MRSDRPMLCAIPRCGLICASPWAAGYRADLRRALAVTGVQEITQTMRARLRAENWTR